MSSAPQLHRDVVRLTAALDAAVAHIGGDHTRQLCRRIGDAAHALRAGTLPGGREEFAAAVRSLEDGELEDLARTFALQCHLMNVAEERARLRALRSRNDQPRDGVVVAIDRLIEGGATEVDLQALFERALIMPVLTAHPSEARRRSTLDHLMRIERLLEQHDDGRDPGPGAGSVTQSVIEQALDAEVLAFLATDDARARPPTPLDEVESVLEMFRRSLLDVTPRIYRTIEDRLGARFGHRWRLPSFVRWGSWVGGDRDGNPNVTAALTRTVFSRHRAAALGRYLEDVVLLGRTLSMSTVRVAKPLEELEANLERDRERLPEVAARARPRTIHEPWREKLWYVQARLRATLEQRDDSYATAAEYRDDLAVLERSLLAADLAQIADQELRDALRRVDVFGFHLASLDIRQHSAVHDRVVDELFARGGRAGYLALDERGRRSWLCEALDHPLPPERERNGLSADAAEVLATLEVIGRARHELGASACERYVVSFTREVSDLLEVVFLARAAGLAPGDVRPVPLLEQLEDLERAGTIARDILGLPALRRELGRTTELEVMIGYSDSGKQVGYLASSISLRHAQLALVDATRDSGATLTLFHGRGGALGRGGGPESDAIRSQPAGAIRGRLRVTEQGETVNARYAHPEIAERDLELTIAAVLSATLSEHDIDPVDREPAIQSAADAARARYRTLTEDEQRLVRYVVAATPIEDVARLPLGSRPASRKATISLDSLRAIPWVFSWTQSRHGLPGWFGVGTAIDTLVQQVGADRVRSLVERSKFLRALVASCELSLVRSDIDVAGEYAKLAEPGGLAIFQIVADEHRRTKHALEQTLQRTTLLPERPYLAASVARRNAYLDVLSHVQIEAVRRRRANRGDAGNDEQLRRIAFTTIGGIAAGLQTAG